MHHLMRRCRLCLRRNLNLAIRIAFLIQILVHAAALLTMK